MNLDLPHLQEHTVAPPALPPLEDGPALESALTQACRRGPDARTLGALGNVLVRRGAYVDALEAYRSASDLDPADAALAWMCGEIAHVLDDAETSRLYRARALEAARVFSDPLPVAGRSSVLLLLRDAPYSENTPIELILDRNRVAVHKYYLEGDAAAPLPQADVVMTAFGFARGASRAIERAAACAPGINDPHALERTARENVSMWANAIDGVTAPRTVLVQPDALREIEFPSTVRPVDTHAGVGFVLATDRDDVARVLERFPAEAYYVAPFVEYRSTDGFYRKFRAIFVDGEAFAYHYAVSPQWMVHYQTAPMENMPAFRAEEARFLDDPGAFVPQWDRIMRDIARAAGLDYFGIDAAVYGEGVLLFEADAAMLVHDEDARGIFAYKRPYAARIREALHALIANRTLRRTP